MDIGIFLEGEIGTLDKNNKKRVLGEEILASGLCRALEALPDVNEAKVYAPNKLPEKQIDYMIYMNYIVKVVPKYAKKNIMYISNAYPGFNDLDDIYKVLKKQEIDAYFSYSNFVVNYLKNKGETAMFLPFAVDANSYYPREYNKNFDFDVAFVGNNVKEPSRTAKYLHPATKVKNFALFGTWEKPLYIAPSKLFSSIKNLGFFTTFLLFLRNLKNIGSHDTKCIKDLSEISRGKIPQEDMLNILSSSKILLNYTFDVAAKWGVINYRIFEGLACGNFVLTDKIPEVEKELAGCVAFHKGGNDLVKKINYYLSHPEERNAIAKKGYQYFKEHASTKKRAIQIFEYLKCI